MLLVFSADYLSIYDDETIMTDLELLEAIAVDKPCDAKSLKCVASGDHRAQTESIECPVLLACVTTNVVLPVGHITSRNTSETRSRAFSRRLRITGVAACEAGSA